MMLGRFAHAPHGAGYVARAPWGALGLAARVSTAALFLAACVENTSPADNDESSSSVVEEDSGTPDPTDGGNVTSDAGPSKVEGTGGACNATSPGTATSCYGFYCGTNEADIFAETKPAGGCGTAVEVGMICQGDIAILVSECARADPFSPMFEESIKNCVRTNTELEGVENISESCLDCYAVSAECARRNCSTPCLPGDNDECDKCREDEGCTPGFYVCAGMPDPQ